MLIAEDRSMRNEPGALGHHAPEPGRCRTVGLALVLAALISCDGAGSHDSGTPIEVAGWPAERPEGWSGPTAAGDGLVRIERHHGADLVGIILLKPLDRGGAEALEALLAGMRGMGYEVRASADRRERTEGEQRTLLQPIVLSAGADRMVGIVGVHERRGEALGSMFWVADETALGDLVDGYDRFVASLGVHATPRPERTASKPCRTVTTTRMVPQYGGCIGAYCTPSWSVAMQPVTRQICD